MSFPEPNDLPQDHNPEHAAQNEQAAQKEQILKQILNPRS